MYPSFFFKRGDTMHIYYILSSNKCIFAWPIWPELNCPYFHTPKHNPLLDYYKIISIYTTIACRLYFSQSVTRSNSFDWKNTQEKDSSVITAHESTKRLTLALGIFKLRRIIWPFLWKVLEYKIIVCYLPPCRRAQIPPFHILKTR